MTADLFDEELKSKEIFNNRIFNVSLDAAKAVFKSWGKNYGHLLEPEDIAINTWMGMSRYFKAHPETAKTFFQEVMGAEMTSRAKHYIRRSTLNCMRSMLRKLKKTDYSVAYIDAILDMDPNALPDDRPRNAPDYGTFEREKYMVLYDAIEHGLSAAEKQCICALYGLGDYSEPISGVELAKSMVNSRAKTKPGEVVTGVAPARISTLRKRALGRLKTIITSYLNGDDYTVYLRKGDVLLDSENTCPDREHTSL